MNTFLWDVDGVFVDTERLHFEAWRELLKKLGGSHELTLDEYAHCAGRNSRENTSLLCGAMGITPDFEKINPIRRAIYENLRKKEIPIIERNIALIRALKREFQSAKFIAVSAATRLEIEENLAAAKIRDIFNDIISFEQDPTIQRKPKPDIYLFALKKHQSEVSECIAFEDSASGVLAAITAGIFCIALPNNFTKNQNFGQAAFVISSEEKVDVVINKLIPKLNTG